MPTPSFAGFEGTLGDVTIGAGDPESGILIGDLDYTHDNPRVDFFDQWGGVIGLLRDHNAMLTLNVNGEVDDKDGGLNIENFTTASGLANEEFFASAASTYNTLDYADAPTLLDSVSGSQPRGQGRTASFSYIRPIGLKAAP